jgi:cysteinyl-tRNA synthetase
MKIFLYNTLRLKKEEFKEIIPGQVGLYTCGPTVYNFAHLGNLRSYLFEDLLKRVLIYNNFQVKHVMNITDVGHLTGDMDMGDDKVEKQAKKEEKTAWQIADFYTQAFKADLKKLNILEPSIWCKVSDHIKEQIDLIKILEKKGYTYITSDGVYFNTAKFPDYNKLSHLPLENLKEGARVEKNLEKKNPTDFALWKFSAKNSNRQMEWPSPWGIGFPGWHIECSALSLKYLNKQRDIHCGGIDHINVHHSNEIAQSEAATGEKFFNYWLHNAFLNIKGGKKMAKSDNNFLSLDKTISDLNIQAMAYRLASLQVHYRKPMEYSQKALKNSQEALDKLYQQVDLLIQEKKKKKNISGQINQDFKNKFLLAINDDLNSPQALAVLFNLLKSDIGNLDKLATILDFDLVLGLNLAQANNFIDKSLKIEDWPDELKTLIEKRNMARQDKNWDLADKLRKEIEKFGFILEDSPNGQLIVKRKNEK